MNGKKCPLCGDANDFTVTTKYELSCGFVIGDVKSLWKEAKDKANKLSQNTQVLRGR